MDIYDLLSMVRPNLRPAGRRKNIFFLKSMYLAMCRWLCAKEIDKNTIPEMKGRVIELMCLLEKVFPPAFFDIQIHLFTHLVDEVEIAGTVHARWMYWVEVYEGAEGICLPSCKT